MQSGAKAIRICFSDKACRAELQIVRSCHGVGWHRADDVGLRGIRAHVTLLMWEYVTKMSQAMFCLRVVMYIGCLRAD